MITINPNIKIKFLRKNKTKNLSALWKGGSYNLVIFKLKGYVLLLKVVII